MSLRTSFVTWIGITILNQNPSRRPTNASRQLIKIRAGSLTILVTYRQDESTVFNIHTEFCEILQVDPSPQCEGVFQLYDYDKTGQIDAREFLIAVSNYTGMSLISESCDLIYHQALARRTN